MNCTCFSCPIATQALNVMYVTRITFLLDSPDGDKLLLTFHCISPIVCVPISEEPGPCLQTSVLFCFLFQPDPGQLERLQLAGPTRNTALPAPALAGRLCPAVPGGSGRLGLRPPGRPALPFTYLYSWVSVGGLEQTSFSWASAEPSLQGEQGAP